MGISFNIDKEIVKPFDINPALQILSLYSQRSLETRAMLEDLQQRASLLKSAVEQDEEAKNKYDSYQEQLKNAVNLINNNGYDRNLINAATSARNTYLNEIVPMEEDRVAWLNALQGILKQLDSGKNIIFPGGPNVGFDKFYGGKRPIIRGTDIDKKTSEWASIVSNYAKSIIKDPAFKPVAGELYYLLTSENGIQPEEALQIFNNVARQEDLPEDLAKKFNALTNYLTNQKKAILYDLMDDFDKDQINSGMQSAIYSGIGLATQSLQHNRNFMNDKEKLERDILQKKYDEAEKHPEWLFGIGRGSTSQGSHKLLRKSRYSYYDDANLVYVSGDGTSIKVPGDATKVTISGDDAEDVLTIGNVSVVKDDDSGKYVIVNNDSYKELSSRQLEDLQKVVTDFNNSVDSPSNAASNMEIYEKDDRYYIRTNFEYDIPGSLKILDDTEDDDNSDGGLG